MISTTNVIIEFADLSEEHSSVGPSASVSVSYRGCKVISDMWGKSILLIIVSCAFVTLVHEHCVVCILFLLMIPYVFRHAESVEVNPNLPDIRLGKTGPRAESAPLLSGIRVVWWRQRIWWALS